MPIGNPAPRRPRQGYLSPLRYPGGKARLAPFIKNLIRAQEPRPTAYAEPFAGGAGAALQLLVDEVVESIRINDLNPGIAAMWRAVFQQADEFARLIENEPVTLEAWHQHREVYLNSAGHDDLSLGFSTFFLNRCNRSGILTARPIGGLNQDGNWKIDARFTRAELAGRIRYLGQFRRRVRLSQLDARDFIRDLEVDADKVLLYVDPPYIGPGDELYLNKLSFQDHSELAAVLLDTRLRWFLTYDVDDRITDELYPNLRCARFNIKHTAQIQHIGSEYAVFGDEIEVPSLNILPRETGDWVVA
jgi:DNA adenine methylase